MFFYKVKELSNKILFQDISSLDIINSCIKRIKKIDSKLGAFLKLNEHKAIHDALNSNNRITNGKRLSILDGLPIAIKDNIMVKNESMTSASKYLKGYISPYDATVIKKLKKAGIILLGRTNMDEFAMGCSTETSAYQKTVNPWNIKYIPGGSSGGSAVSVSAGMVPFALGSDTGGSIRQPASFCGIVGYKPTYGLVSRYGICALASSFDQIGILAKTVEDTMLLINIIKGIDYKDPTTCDYKELNDNKHYNNKNLLKGLRIGIPKQLINYRIDNVILDSFNESIKKLELEGVKILEIDIPEYKYIPALYKVIMCAEVSANIATFDGMRYGYRAFESIDLNDEYSKTRAESLGYEVKKRILFGTYVLSKKHYNDIFLHAQKIRTLLIERLEKIYKKCDFIFSPATMQMPVKFGEHLTEDCDVFLIAANLAGLPGITIPYKFVKNLPLGVHFMGSRFSDKLLLEVANNFEKIIGFNINKFPNCT